MTTPLNEHTALYCELKELVQEVVEDINYSMEGRGRISFAQEEPEEVPYKHTDGFIPFTDGGVYSWCFASCDCFEGLTSLPKHLKEIVRNEVKDNFIDAMLQTDTSLSGMDYDQLDNVWNRWHETDAYEKLDAFRETEDSFYEGGEHGIRCGVHYHAHLEDSLCFYLTVNVDAPYYRDNRAFRASTGMRGVTVDFLIYGESISLGKLLKMKDFQREAYLRDMKRKLAKALWIPLDKA